MDNIKFVIPEKKTSKPIGIVNLIDTKFDVFAYLPKNFTITTKDKKIYNFNRKMIHDTSSVLKNFINSNLNNFGTLNYQLDIEDNNNLMAKIEQLYFGKEVSFSKNDFNLLKIIVEKLDLSSFPPFIKDNSINFEHLDGLKLIIDNNSLLSFLRFKYPNNFIIGTNKKNYNCNSIGIHSSNVYEKRIVNKGPNKIDYKYNFNDENEEFQIIVDYFNFSTIKIKPSNVRLLRKISKDLQIKSLLAAVDEYINSYENTMEIINDKRPIINCIDELLEYLCNRKNASIEATKEYLINSIWLQTKENCQELVAYMLQIIYTNINLHPFLINLLNLFNKNEEENSKAKMIISLLVQKLMNDIGYNKLNCAFIYKLSENGFISKNEIVDTINKIIDIKHRFRFNDNLTYSERFLKNNIENYVYIDYDRLYNMLVWFFCELNEIKNISFSYIIDLLDSNHKNFLKSYYPNNLEKYKKMRNSGEPDDELTKALKNDDVEKLKPFYKQGWGIRNEINVPFNLFDTFVKNGETNCLNYAAANGSIECFKFILTNNYFVDSKTLCYAYLGQNKEIIDIVYKKEEEKNRPNIFTFVPQSKIYQNGLCPNIFLHINDTLDWLLENKYDMNLPGIDYIIKYIFMNGNIHAFIKFIEEGLNLCSLKVEDIVSYISISANSGFYRLTQLMLTIISKNEEFLNKLLKKIKVEDFYSFGNLSIIKLLDLLKIKNANYENALALSIIRDYFDNVKYILESLGSEKIKLSSESALILIKLSIFKKKTDFYEYLTNKLVGLDSYIKEFPSINDDSVFHLACDLGNFEIIKLFYKLIDQKKIKFDFTDSFISAASKGFNDICSFLIEEKVFMQFSILLKSDEELTKLNLKTFILFYNLADQEEKEQFMSNFLYSAIKNHNKDIVAFLLEKSVSYKNALINSVLCNDVEITKLILQHDNKQSFINYISNKGSALNIAVLSNNIEIVKILLSIKGIDPSLRTKEEKSPLINAFTHFSVNIIEMILEFYGDDIQSKISELNKALRIILSNFSHNRSFISSPSINSYSKNKFSLSPNSLPPSNNSSSNNVSSKPNSGFIFNFPGSSNNSSQNNLSPKPNSSFSFNSPPPSNNSSPKPNSGSTSNLSGASNNSTSKPNSSFSFNSPPPSNNSSPKPNSGSTSNLSGASNNSSSNNASLKPNSGSTLSFSDASNNSSQNNLSPKPNSSFSFNSPPPSNNSSSKPNAGFSFSFSRALNDSSPKPNSGFSFNFPPPSNKLSSNNAHLESKSGFLSLALLSDNEITLNKFLEIPNIDLNIYGGYYTLLTYACEKNMLNIVSNMISKENVNLNLHELQNGNTPLMVAIENDNFRIAELLLSNPRTNVNWRNFQMKTALMLASAKNSTKIVELIIKNQNFDPIESRLDCSFMISGKDASFSLLSVKELDVNYKDEDNEYEYDTSLIHAVKNKEIEKVDKIIQHQSFDPVKSQIRNAIFVASKLNNIEIFKKLLALINNDINIYSQDNDSLLIVSCENNSKDVITNIIDNPNFDSIKSQLNCAVQKLLSNESNDVFIDIVNYCSNFRVLLEIPAFSSQKVSF